MKTLRPISINFANLQMKLLSIFGISASICIIGSSVWAQQENLKAQQSLNPFSGSTHILQLGRVSGLAYSPDGKTLASGHYSFNAYHVGGTGEVRLWDAPKRTFLRALTKHESNVTSVAFSPDGKTLASGNFRYIPPKGYAKSVIGEVTLWDAETGELQKTLAGHGDTNSVAFSPDGQTLATAGGTPLLGGEVKLWSTQTGELQRTISKADVFSVHSAVFAPDGKTLISGGEDGRVRIWDARSGDLQRTLEAPQGTKIEWEAVAISPDGKLVAAGGRKVRIELGQPPFAPKDNPADVLLWDAQTGQLQMKLTGHAGMVLSVAFSPDGKTLATGGYGDEIRMWDAKTGAFLGRSGEWSVINGHAFITALVFSPDSGTLASGSDNGTVKLWRLQPEAKAQH